MVSSTPISAVAIGIGRATAEKTDIFFTNTPYKLVAIMDKTESPEALQYTPQNLAVVLNALFPRPRILITGTAIPDDLLPDIESVWDAYVKQWGVDGLWVAMSKTHPSPGTPPPPGSIEHTMATLNNKFQA